MSSQPDRQSGTVSWFNEEKGFGFITAEDGRDVFVHYSEVQRDGFQTLAVGETVTFLIAEEGPAPKASSVRPV